MSLRGKTHRELLASDPRHDGVRLALSMLAGADAVTGVFENLATGDFRGDCWRHEICGRNEPEFLGSWTVTWGEALRLVPDLVLVPNRDGLHGDLLDLAAVSLHQIERS